MSVLGSLTAVTGLGSLWGAYHRVKWAACSDLWILEGIEKSSGKRLTFAYAGQESYKNYLARMAFGERRFERLLGRHWPSQVAPRVAREAPDCSLLVYEVPQGAERVFWCRSDFRVPVWVRLELPLPKNMDELRKSKKFRQVERSIIEEHGLTYSISKSSADFEDFYYNLYLPYVTTRHEETGVVHPHEDLKRKFGECELLLVHADGSIVAAGLIQNDPEMPHCLYLGVRGGDMDWVRKGVLEALYFFQMKHLISRGFVRVNLGHSRAFLSDGSLRFKRERGAVLVDKHFEPSGTLRLRVLRRDEGLTAFFSKNPFVTIDRGVYRHAFYKESSESPQSDDPRSLYFSVTPNGSIEHTAA